jgi:hypothetical protein
MTFIWISKRVLLKIVACQKLRDKLSLVLPKTFSMPHRGLLKKPVLSIIENKKITEPNFNMVVSILEGKFKRYGKET